MLGSDELSRRSERLLERRRKQAQFRDPQKTLDNFDFDFNKKMIRSLVFDIATGAFISRHSHDELADAALDRKRKEHMEFLSSAPLLILDDLGMRKLRLTVRGVIGDHHAALRVGQYVAHLESTGGGLGETAGSCCRCHRYARSPSPPWPCA